MSAIPGYDETGALEAGPHGRSFRARRRRSGGGEVVVKLLQPVTVSGIRRLRVDLQALAAAGHPAIQMVRDIVELDDEAVAIITPAEPTSLRARLEAGPLDQPGALPLMADVAGALAVAHRSGVLHLGVSSANVLLRDDGSVRLVDFGVARAMGATDDCSPAVDVRAAGDLWLEALIGRPVPDAEVRASDLVADLDVEAGEIIDAARAGRLDAAELSDRIRSICDRAETPRAARALVIPDPPAPVRQGRSRAFVVAAAVVILAGLAVAIRPSGASNDRTDDAAPALPPCVGAVAPRPGETTVAGDLNGRGCLDTVLWAPALAEATVADGPTAGRYRLGDPGDVLLLGDWDADSVDTPAVYRPSTGEVHQWDAWAADGVVTRGQRAQTGPIDGSPAVIRSEDGDEVSFDDGSG